MVATLLYDLMNTWLWQTLGGLIVLSSIGAMVFCIWDLERENKLKNEEKVVSGRVVRPLVNVTGFKKDILQDGYFFCSIEKIIK